jgi:hypothetical protein
MLDIGDSVWSNSLQDFLCDGRFTGSRTASNSDHEWGALLHERIIPAELKKTSTGMPFSWRKPVCDGAPGLLCTAQSGLSSC